MKHFLFLFLLSTWMPMAAAAAVLKQDNHQKILFSEDYSGYYVMAYTSLGQDKVRLETCEASGHATANCKFLMELSYAKFKSHESAMLKTLRDYREEVKEKKNNFWLFFSRGGMKSRDVEGIDKMIAEIEQNGLGQLPLLTDENIQKDALRMTTPEFARELTSRMKAVLETGEPMGLVDCIPYLRKQGL